MTINRTPAPPECDPERVETVARALAEAQGVGRTATPLTRRLAAAAIAADPSPAEEAVKRVEALVERWRANGGWDLLYVAELLAALASPAPAPQGEPCGVDPCDCDHPSHDQRAKTADACRRFNQKLIDGAR